MFKLRLQFFFVMLIICILLTAGLYLYIKVNFQKDFWRYIEKKETRFAQPLITDLIRRHRTEKNWSWITQWEDYIITTLENEKRQRSQQKQLVNPIDQTQEADKSNPASKKKRTENSDQQKPPLPKENSAEPSNSEISEWRLFRFTPPLSALKSIFLLNENESLVAGKDLRSDGAFLIPLMDKKKLIGYLGVPFNPAFRDLPDADFAKLQEEKFAFVILIAFAIASFISFPVAHLLTKRINNLVGQVNLFGKGNYKEKISIDGKDELSVLAEHLNNLGEILAQSEQMRRQWVADISHELRTPIAVLQADLEAMEDGVRPLNKTAISRLIKHNLRLKHLVNDLYELSLTDLGGMTYSKNILDLSALLKDSVNSMHPQFTSSGIELIFKDSPNPITIYGDQNRLQQLFINLLKNSLQYTNAPGTTVVTINLIGDDAVISIEDTAPGVAEEHHSKLFDRLYRADSSRNRATGGAGLGLSICKNIVAAHDGKITTSNSSLGGLNITINIPTNRITQ